MNLHPQHICQWHQTVCCSQHTGGKECHPEGSGKGLCELHEVQQGAELGLGRSQAQVQAGRRTDSEQPWEKGLGAVWGKNSIWPSNVDSQPRKSKASWAAYKESQSAVRWFSPPLLCSCEIWPGVLCSALGPPTRKMCGPLEWIQRRAHTRCLKQLC